jgi:hypothetical protein
MRKTVDDYGLEDWKIMRSDEYKAYLKALCRLASGYVSRIRVKFAERAYEKFSDPTIRKLVLAYGAECDDLDKKRLSDFEYVAKYGATTEESLNDWCLNNSGHYAKAIWFLFGIDDKKEGEE